MFIVFVHALSLLGTEMFFGGTEVRDTSYMITCETVLHISEQRVPEEEEGRPEGEDLPVEDEQNESDDEDMEEGGEREDEEHEETGKAESADAEGGGSKDDEKAGDEPKAEPEKEVQEECAKPSEDHPAETPAEPAVQMDLAPGSEDQVSVRFLDWVYGSVADRRPLRTEQNVM
jgi:hypothetical protein